MDNFSGKINNSISLKRISLIPLAYVITLLFFRFWLTDFLVFYNTNIHFLFIEDLSSLKEYYPRFYYPIFIITRFIIYLIPLLLIIIAFVKRRNLYAFLKKYYAINYESAYWWKSELFIFIATLLITIFYYFTSKDNTSFSQLDLSQLFLKFQIANFLLFVIVHYQFLVKKLHTYLSIPTLPYSLAITRIIFFSYAIFLYLGPFKIGMSNFDGLVKQPLPLIDWLINITPVNNELYLLLCYLGAFFSFMIIIGYKTRFFLILNAFTIFYVTATPNFFGKSWHMHIVIWIAWILAASPCFDIFAIENLKKKKEIVKHSKYGFYLKIIWLHFGFIYFFAGFYKLWQGGLDWALSQSMINQVQLEWFENFNKIPQIRIDHFPNLLKLGGLLAILFEMSFIFLLLKKKTQWISIFGGLLMHNMIGYFMYISFFVFLQVFYFVFIPWNYIVLKLKPLHHKPKEIIEKINLKKLSYSIPIAILSLNFLAGIFCIYSYPFTAYPAYSQIVPDTFQFLEYKIIDEKYKDINLWEEADKTYFTWESFSRFEPTMVEKYRTENIIDTFAIGNQWNRWTNGIPFLLDIDTIEVYGVEIYLQPELQKDTLYKEYLMTISK